MSSQLTSEQDSNLSKFLDMPVYESIGNPTKSLLSLINKYNTSKIDEGHQDYGLPALSNIWYLDDDDLYTYSKVLSLEIVGKRIGSINIKPNIKQFSIHDWYTEEIWGYTINPSLFRDTPSELTYKFLEELQGIFSDVGTAKDPAWDINQRPIYFKNVKNVKYTSIALGLPILFDPQLIDFIVPVVFFIVGKTILDYRKYHNSQLEFNISSFKNNVIIDTFYDIYKTPLNL
ncbi:MAG: hypothetical protein K0B07_03265 [DPANN group archaeon]|nr:hypothetical protein [DPANN group archaeon]